MNARRRVLRALLIAGAVGVVLAVSAGVVEVVDETVTSHGLLPWALAVAVPTYAVGALVYRARPGHPSAQRLLAFGALMGVAEGAGGAWVLLGDAAPTWALALLGQVGFTGATVAIAQLLALFPEGQVETSPERWLVTVSAGWLAVPLLTTVANPLVVDPAMGYGNTIGSVSQPLHLALLAPLGGLAEALYQGAQALVLAGGALLVARYRRGEGDRRRAARWLLLPVIATVLMLIPNVVLSIVPGGESLRSQLDPLWPIVIWLTLAGLALGLVRGGGVGVDLVLRRSLVYGVLWTLIGAVYLGVTAALGLAAASQLPVGAAIVLTIAATLAVQPGRRWLDGLADRWVFGERLSRYETLRRLGASLEESFDLAQLLPRLAAAVRDGLGVPWTRVVVLDAEAGDADRDAASVTGTAGDVPDGGSDPALVVPVVRAGETIGRIACGAPPGRQLDDADEELVVELARQAALGISVLRLHRELERHVDELRVRGREVEESRARLVRAQEIERRRIERDLHDGVQQEVVALMGHVGLARRHLDARHGQLHEVLDDVNTGLRRILGAMRDLAQGIHPTVLADRGLVEAVEEQAGRCPVPVVVRVDANLRSQRFAPEVEGAAYFTVSEGLANVLKHAGASVAEVHLRRRNGTLEVVVRDDGRGFDTTGTTGNGLRNLSERLEALGGRLDVTSARDTGTTLSAALLAGDVDG